VIANCTGRLVFVCTPADELARFGPAERVWVH
jgi:hypothetical protein